MPASRACEPRVAETWVWLISFRLIGRAPICRIVARSWASCGLVKPPEIWAPVRPSIPSGFWEKLMIGRVLTSLSRTTAKWPESAAACSPETGPIACAWPRWAIWRVTSWKASRPSSVKPKLTLGSLNSPNSCFGSVMSVPESAGSSFSAYQPGCAVLSTWPLSSLGIFGDDDRSGGDLDDDAVFRPFFPGRADVEVLFGELRTGDQLVRILFLEEVVARFGDRAVLAVLDRLLFGGEQGGAVGVRVGAGEDQLLVLEAGRFPAGFFPAFFGCFQRPRRRLLAGACRRSPARGRSGSAPSRRSRAARSCRPGRSRAGRW